ncbi:MAG: serine/threonine-protein kinase [Sandaracinaceae bacterium]
MNVPGKPFLGPTHSVDVDGRDLVELDASTRGALGPQIGFHERYEVLGTIGSGGMGEVKLCRDRTVGREVAMKIIRQSDTGSPRRWRFVREARIQGQLEHPAVVPVYDFGVDPEGNLYFTMKRVRGVSLAEVIEALAAGDPTAERRWGRRRLLTAFSQVCLAVGFIHSRGVVHRDLKPSNVMLGDFGEIYVLDWGLVKLIGRLGAADRGLVDASNAATTGQGSVLGTPGYMSPEQLRGEVDRVDQRADVYSLGSILFELLVREPLHPRGATKEKLISVLTTDGARTRSRPRGLSVPDALDDLVARATRLHPEDRLETASAMSEAIEAYLDAPG